MKCDWLQTLAKLEAHYVHIHCYPEQQHTFSRSLFVMLGYYLKNRATTVADTGVPF